MAKETPLKDVLKKVISNLQKREEEEGSLFKAWEEAVGEKTAKHTKPVFFKEKRLIVNVSDSPRLYKLTLEKKKLIERFNKNMKGKKKIKELQFRIGDI